MRLQLLALLALFATLLLTTASQHLECANYVWRNYWVQEDRSFHFVFMLVHSQLYFGSQRASRQLHGLERRASRTESWHRLAGLRRNAHVSTCPAGPYGVDLLAWSDASCSLFQLVTAACVRALYLQALQAPPSPWEGCQARVLDAKGRGTDTRATEASPQSHVSVVGVIDKSARRCAQLRLIPVFVADGQRPPLKRDTSAKRAQ